MKTRIKRIEIKNYRQYEHLEIDFDADKNLYAFVGRNHAGKTNIINAISWCLYGDEPFKDKNKDDKLLSTNIATNPETRYSKIQVSIEVEIDESRILYNRSLIETDDPNLDQANFEVFLFNNGDWVHQEANPNYFVERFLPLSLRYFFMFPGEDLKKIFSEGYEKNLKKNVHIVSNVALIEETIKHLNIILQETRREEANLNPELGDMVGQISSIENQLKQDKKILIQNNEILTTKEAKIKEMRLQQSKIEVHKALIAEMRGIEASLGSEEDHLYRYVTGYKAIIGKSAPFVFLYKNLIDFSMNLKSLEEKGDIPPKVSSEFIEDLIAKKNKGNCICGNHITEASVKSFELVLKDINSSEENMFLYNSNIRLAHIIKEINASYNIINDLKGQIISTKRRIDDLSKQQKEFSKKIIEEGEDIGSLEDAIVRYAGEVDDIKKAIWKNEQDIAISNSTLKNLDDRLKKSEMSKKVLIFHSAKRILIDEIIKKYQIMLEENVKTTRSIMSNTIRVYFKELFWDTNNLKDIYLNENYEIIFEKDIGGTIVRQPLTQLSGGEKICLGYSLMKGLAELSGFSEVPVFIDGPISDADEGVEKTFLEKLPTFMTRKQLFIFFKADTSIETFISKHLKVLQAFKLEKKDNGSTIVKEWN